MGKIRSKNLKPKTGSDFKKTKAKVGRRIKSSTETKIVVQSKDVVLRNQSIERQKTGSEKETIERILKQFNHYSTSNRSIALSDFKKLMESSDNAESHIAMILPDAMALLHDIEQQPRKNCVEVLSIIFARFSTLRFQAVSPIIITYICSGLTNLHKGVRKDSLLVLSSLAQHHPRLLLSSFSKIVEYILALLADPSQSGGQDSLAASNERQGTEEKNKKEPKKKSAMLAVILSVLRKILSYSSEVRAEAISDKEGGGPPLTYNIRDSSSNAVLVLRPRPLTNLLTERKRHMDSSLSERDADLSNWLPLPLPLLTKLCVTLRGVWSGLLVAENSMVALETAAVLGEVCAITLVLGTACAASSVKEYRALVAAVFSSFPHCSLEASVSAPDSDAGRRGRLAIDLLDLSVCSIALQTEGATAAAQGGAREYMVRRLEEYVEELDSRAALAGPAEDSASIVATLFSGLQAMALSDAQGVSLPVIFASVLKVLRRVPGEKVRAKQRWRSIVGCALRCAAAVVADPRFWTLPVHAAALPFLADILCCAFGLVVSCRAELGYLTAAMVKAAHSFLQLRSSSEDRIISLAVAKVSEGLLGLYKDVKANRVAATGDSSAFHLSGTEDRCALLDTFFYSKFDSFADAARVVIKCVAKASTAPSEQQYFLKLFYDCRFNLTLPDFFALLFFSLGCNVRSAVSGGAAARLLRKEVIAGAARDAVLCRSIETWHAAGYSSSIAEVILWCSSPESPSNVVKYMLPVITGFVADAPGDVSDWGEGFMRSQAGLLVLHLLLLPCLESRPDGSLPIEGALLQEAVGVLAQLAGRLLVGGAVVPSALLVAPLALAVEDSSRRPAVFCCLLRQLTERWPDLAAAERGRVLQALLHIASQPAFADALQQCGEDVRAFLEGKSCPDSLIDKFNVLL